ncbi:MAG: response regulator [Actinobacteria bacterium]|nr:response regulator [Actinomycetota bacterium]
MGYRVLLAEDTADIRDLMKLHLSVDGRFEVVAETESGDEVLELARDEQPDLLITDMTLDGTSGVPLIQAMRRECPGCKILVFSGLAGSSRDTVSDAGADGVMEKTVHSFEEVVAAALALCEA